MNRNLASVLRLLALAFSVIGATAAPSPIPIANPGFERDLEGWRPLFTREPQSGRASVDRTEVHSGKSAARIEHTGAKDWSFEPSDRLPATPGDFCELRAWVKLEGTASATLAVALWDAARQNRGWSHGAKIISARPGWQLIRTRFVVPDGVTQIQPRLLGGGPIVVWVDDFSLERKSNLAALRGRDLPAALRRDNSLLEVSLDTTAATLAVHDRRSGRRWTQRPLNADLVVARATAREGGLDFALLHLPSGLEVAVELRLDPSRPEFTLSLHGEGELPEPIAYPHPFSGEVGDYLVVPMNEGISYPVDDATIPPMRLVAYGGHGICMPFWGLTDGTRGQMAILESPDDASIRIDRLDRKLAIAPVWEAQRGQFGYLRRVRYVFLDQGGHVAMAKRYRAHAQQTGLFKTLEAKRRTLPAVERLYGAVNVWCWERDAVAMVQELQAAGIQRILWSNRQGPPGIAAMNALGVLTSRYDLYQDVMDPAQFPRLRSIHPDWTTAAWPRDLMRDRHGQWIPGWEITTKDGATIPCGVLCDYRAPDYARTRVSAELTTHPYLGRFIDTTTASAWRECYDPAHPLTRSDSRHWKMELLRQISEEHRLVTGSETGHDAAVPYLHFFEGMMSLGPYRVPDSGRRMQQIWDEVPERVAKFQLGHAYRLPLFELVYHDCVVSYWYWGDYNNKLPALWDKRDLFNLLYGVPPMFMFDRKIWSAHRARFVQSYQNTCPAIAQIAAAEMTDHRFLTPDRAVQQTHFANGVTVTVNFGSAPFTLPGGGVVGPLGQHVAGLR